MGSTGGGGGGREEGPKPGPRGEEARRGEGGGLRGRSVTAERDNSPALAAGGAPHARGKGLGYMGQGEAHRICRQLGVR